eukprot:324441-Amphidinium_carterae.1
MTQYWQQQHHPQQLFGHRLDTEISEVSPCRRLQLQGPNLSRFGNFGGPRLPPVPKRKQRTLGIVQHTRGPRRQDG